MAKLKAAGTASDQACKPSPPSPPRPLCANVYGFSRYAAVRFGADDHHALE